MDSDGDSDLAVGNWHGNSVSLFSNSGDGHLLPAVHYGTSWEPNGSIAGDFDNDGHADLAVSCESNYRQLPFETTILWNTGSTSSTLFCCGQYVGGKTGNVDCDTEGRRNLADITLMIDHVYISKTDLCCEKNGNVDGDPSGNKNLADITKLIDHVYLSKVETANCN